MQIERADSLTGTGTSTLPATLSRERLPTDLLFTYTPRSTTLCVLHHKRALLTVSDSIRLTVYKPFTSTHPTFALQDSADGRCGDPLGMLSRRWIGPSVKSWPH